MNVLKAKIESLKIDLEKEIETLSIQFAQAAISARQW